MTAVRREGFAGTVRVARRPPLPVVFLLALMTFGALLSPRSAEGAASVHFISLFTSADSARETLARIINHSDRAGTVSIHGTDDLGQRRGPITLSLNPKATRHFTSLQLETGDSSTGLSNGLGNGEGDWRLELRTDLDIEAFAYVRSDGVYLSVMHDVVRLRAIGDDIVHHVPIFNAASDRSRASRLRLVNFGEGRVEVTIQGRDDTGQPAPGGEVRLTLPAGSARSITAQQLESGSPDLDGRFGEGTGKWQLFVSADGAIEVTNLLLTPTGHLINLSASGSRRNGTPEYSLPLLPAAGHAQQGFARIINHSNRAGEVSIHGIDDTGERHGPVILSLESRETRNFNVRDLEEGNAQEGLSSSLGDGEGNWRLEFRTDLDIEPLAYIGTAQGFLSAVHTLVRPRDGGDNTVHHVPIFSAASSRTQTNWLRVANLGDDLVEVTIQGRDDDGRRAPEGEVRLTLSAGSAQSITAQELEYGSSDIHGRFGDGTGNWQLFVSAGGDIDVVSLVQSSAGHVANLSSRATPGFAITASGSATVRPMQTIALDVPGGLGDSEYQILIDLSGTGVFDQVDTIEVEGLTTDQSQILLAVPMTQVLPDQNTRRTGSRCA